LSVATTAIDIRFPHGARLLETGSSQRDPCAAPSLSRPSFPAASLSQRVAGLFLPQGLRRLHPEPAAGRHHRGGQTDENHDADDARHASEGRTQPPRSRGPSAQRRGKRKRRQRGVQGRAPAAASERRREVVRPEHINSGRTTASAQRGGESEGAPARRAGKSACSRKRAPEGSREAGTH
jgi:hypothetical protein